LLRMVLPDYPNIHGTHDKCAEQQGRPHNDRKALFHLPTFFINHLRL
jgi:hypothetical protein